MMQDTLYHGYNFLFGMIYVKSLQKLTMEHILIMYRKFHDIYTLKNHLSIFSKNYMTQNIIIELLNRQMSLKTIVDCLMEHIVLTSNNLITILTCVEKYIKHGEYWNTVRTLVLRLLPNVSKHIIQEILVECIESEKFTDIQDVNDNLINKVPPVLISELDKDIVERFKKGLLAEKTGDNSCPEILIQNFGESLPETIASPDGNTNLSQTESPKHSDILIDKSVDENNDHITKVNGETYKLRPIGNYLLLALPVFACSSVRAFVRTYIFFIKNFETILYTCICMYTEKIILTPLANSSLFEKNLVNLMIILMKQIHYALVLIKSYLLIWSLNYKIVFNESALC